MNEFEVNDIVWFNNKSWMVQAGYKSFDKHYFVVPVGRPYDRKVLVEDLPADAKWLVKYGTLALEIDMALGLDGIFNG